MNRYGNTCRIGLSDASLQIDVTIVFLKSTTLTAGKNTESGYG